MDDTVASKLTRPFTAEAVLAEVERHVDELKRLGVKRLGLFGSVARGEATLDSDLDFIVDLERETFDCYFDTKFLLEDLFGCRVDLVMTDVLKPRLRPRVMSEVRYVPRLG
jgi:uncharacterized protein